LSALLSATGVNWVLPEIDTFNYKERAYRRMTTETYIEPAFLLPDLIEIQRSSFRWFGRRTD